MYSEFRLNVQLDKNRKITDVNYKYKIGIVPFTDLPQSFYEYSMNFHDAAHHIASYLLEEDRFEIDSLDSYFFPLAFSYRHSIELILKALAFRNLPDKISRINFAKDTFHDLAKILDEVLKLENGQRAEEEIEWLKKYFADASQIDKESDSFRYPYHIIRAPGSLSEEPQFSMQKVFEKQTHINLVLFANKCEAAFEILNLWFNKSNELAVEWKKLKPVFIEMGGCYYGQSVVGYAKNDFYPYVNGFLETAAYIRNQMKNLFDFGEITKASELFMPMCYLYRNAVELAIKEAWFEEVGEDFQQRCKILNKKKHSISGLWNQLRKWIGTFWGEECSYTIYFNDITIACDKLQGFDGTASRFRYPCTKDMDLYFNKKTTLDFMNIAEFMESLIYSIDSIGNELNRRNDYIDEINAEYRAEMESEYIASMYGNY